MEEFLLKKLPLRIDTDLREAILAKHEELLREQKHGASSMCCDLREQAVAELAAERERSKRLAEALRMADDDCRTQSIDAYVKRALAEYEKGGKPC